MLVISLLPLFVVFLSKDGLSLPAFAGFLLSALPSPRSLALFVFCMRSMVSQEK